MSEEIASHSEEITTETGAQDTTVEEAFAAFGLDTPSEQDTPVEGNEEGEKDDAPAIEHQPKTIKVKHNKEEVEVDISDEKLTDHLQRSLALDKERERKTEYEKALDRVAKQQGFTDHAELIANLDKIEQEKQQQQQDEYEQLREKMISELEYNGVNREDAIAYLENNPVLQQAKQAMVEAETIKAQQTQAEQAAQWNQKWDALYKAYPDLLESAKVFADGVTPDWYTPDMQARIDRGYDPVDAFELAHKNTIQTQTKKAAEQKVIKDQMLGKRSQVETVTPADNEPSIPDDVADQFKAFGLPPSAAKKYLTK